MRGEMFGGHTRCMHPSDTLLDPLYRVPEPPTGTTGVAWLRSHVPRFSEGNAHARRRAQVDDVLAQLTVEPVPGEDPTSCLLRSFGLPAEATADIELIAACYHPHQPTTPAADAAVERMIVASGGRTESTAAKICILVQAHAGTHALIEVLREGEGRPPVPYSRRVGPDGDTVEVSLDDAHFGRGAHACPGEALGRRLAEEALR